jgi:prevent-host-death family protein
MTIYNIYEAKTNLSKILDLVEQGEEVIIARSGKPVADLTKHAPKKNTITFGIAAGKLHYKDEDLICIDPEIQDMFYGKDHNKT